MVLADAYYKIIYFDVGARGRSHDAGVFNNCSLFKSLDKLNIPPPQALPNSNISTPFVIVADDAFALKCYLMKPYSFRDISDRQKIYNYRLSRATCSRKHFWYSIQ